MVQFSCQCQPGNGPILIRGVDLSVVCNKCHTIYKIAQVQYDGRMSREVQVEVVDIGKVDEAVNS